MPVPQSPLHKQDGLKGAGGVKGQPHTALALTQREKAAPGAAGPNEGPYEGLPHPWAGGLRDRGQPWDTRQGEPDGSSHSSRSWDQASRLGPEGWKSLIGRAWESNAQLGSVRRKILQAGRKRCSEARPAEVPAHGREMRLAHGAAEA